MILNNKKHLKNRKLSQLKDLNEDWKTNDLHSIQEYKEAFIIEGMPSKWYKIKQLFIPEIIFQVEKSLDSSFPHHTTRIGGIPHLPIESKWPIVENEHLTFLVQINLKDIDNTHIEKKIPKEGKLLFFYNPKNIDREKTVLFLYDEIKVELKPVPKNLNHGILSTYNVKSKKSYSLPNTDNKTIEACLNEDQNDSYTYIRNSETKKTKLLGYADSLQGDMLYDDTFLQGTDKTWNLLTGKEQEEQKAQWTLLFQLDSINEEDIMWGDTGRLYFWIKKTDLENHFFENVMMLMQCY